MPTGTFRPGPPGTTRPPPDHDAPDRDEPDRPALAMVLAPLLGLAVWGAILFLILA